MRRRVISGEKAAYDTPYSKAVYHSNPAIRARKLAHARQQNNDPAYRLARKLGVSVSVARAMLDV